MGAYRDDLGASVARADALEREIDALRRRIDADGDRVRALEDQLALAQRELEALRQRPGRPAIAPRLRLSLAPLLASFGFILVAALAAAIGAWHLPQVTRVVRVPAVSGGEGLAWRHPASAPTKTLLFDLGPVRVWKTTRPARSAP